MKKTGVIAVMLTALLCAGAVWGQGMGGPGGPGRGQAPGGPHRGPGFMMSPAMAVMPLQPAMIDRIAPDLKLTHDQTVRLKRITTKGSETMRPLVEKASEASRALRAAVLAPRYDVQRVRSLAQSAMKAESAVVRARIDEWTHIRAVLTRDQAQDLQKVMTMRRPTPGGPGGPRPGMPGGPAPGEPPQPGR